MLHGLKIIIKRYKYLPKNKAFKVQNEENKKEIQGKRDI